MMIAAQNKNREIIELLAGAHADLNIKEKVLESFFNYHFTRVCLWDIAMTMMWF